MPVGSSPVSAAGRAPALLALALLAGCTCAPVRSPPDAAPAPAPRIVAIARDRAGPTSIALDREHVYWVERATGDLMRAPRGGGEATRLGGTGWMQSDALAVGGGFVYYRHPGEGATFRMPSSGGSPERVGPPGPLAADATHVYVAAATLVRIPHVAPPPGAAAEPRWPAESAPDEEIRGGVLALGPSAACTIDGSGVLRCASLEGGEVRTLARGFGRSHALALAVSSAHAYASDGEAGLTLRVPLSGGAPELAADATGIADAIAADPRFLYVAGVDGIVRRVDPSRASSEIVASIPGTNRNHVSVALEGATLFVASDASSATVAHLDLTGRTPLPPGDLVRWEGWVGAVDLALAELGRADRSRPLEPFAFLAWIDREDDASLARALDRVRAGVPALDAGLRSGRLALRVSCADRAFSERTVERLRERLAPTHGAALRVLADPSVRLRAQRDQCEIVIDLRELAASYAP